MSDLLERTKDWAPKDKERAAKEIHRQQSKDIRHWFCNRVPAFDPERDEMVGCDGRPHPGYEYPHARAKQWPPPGKAWRLWLVMSGRGWGKTATGANWIRKVSERVERSAMIGRRGTDVRGTMVEGDSGLIKVCEAAGVQYDWQPSKREFTFGNGHKVFGYSAEEPDSLRGPQHGAGWLDEPAHFDDLQLLWANYKFGLRLLGMPGGTKTLATSTPLPLDWIEKRLSEKTTFVTRGSTFENESNLDQESVDDMRREFEGTRLGRQELYGEIIKDVEGALWNHDLFTYDVVRLDGFDRIIIAVDPAGTANRRSDETGIVVVGKLGDEFWVLEDASGKYTPNAWAEKLLALYEKWEADAIVAEKNYGGDMVESNIKHAVERKKQMTPRILIATAMRSKQLRAEPVVGLYEQRRVHHVRGLDKLEKEMVEWVPGKGDSPNRVDALVWAVTELAGKRGGPAQFGRPTGRIVPGGPAGAATNLMRRSPWNR